MNVSQSRSGAVVPVDAETTAALVSEIKRLIGTVGDLALRQALAQPEQEPVAWVTFNAYGEEDDVWYENPEGKLLDGWTYKPLYTAPPNSEWQGLTDEEFEEAVDGLEDLRDCWIQIEAKLKEKNT